MLDSSTTVALVFALATAMYLLVAAAAGTLRGPRLLAAVAAGAVIVLWLIRGSLIARADVDLTLLARRAGVLLCGGGAALAYVAIRRDREVPRALTIVCPVLLAAGGFLAGSNWIVGLAALVVGAAAGPRMKRAQTPEE